ncbi:MAG TPA: hypothetical protein VJK03_05445 [Candidatus Nanoarchaeia archaeon]|nr:hypothetical protein [Candidatus Nanoarchaeia archaeon]
MAETQQAQPPMSKDEQLGFHKGAISTLAAERNELLRLVSITESLIQAHAKELEKLGVKLQEQPKQDKKP